MSDGEERARASARVIFNHPNKPVEYEPAGDGEAAAAVDALAGEFSKAGGTIAQMIANARAAAQTLSDDPLQGLSEIVQNANDAGATWLAFHLAANELLVHHDGRDMNLQDLWGLAAPWLTTKTDDVKATGRFGIGLSTLHSLADSFEMHSGSYHVRVGDPTLENVPVFRNSVDAAGADRTVMRVPLQKRAVTPEEFLAWSERWNDESLLFLDSVRTVRFQTESAERVLNLQWTAKTPGTCEISGAKVAVVRRLATASDGRQWVVHDADAPTPKGLKRAHKQTGHTTPVAVALALHDGSREQGLYAGLPLMALPYMLCVNGQFDPITSRRGVAETPWNLEIVRITCELWKHAILRLFDEQPARAWSNVPVGAADAQQESPAIQLLADALEARALECAHELRLLANGERLPLSELAVEVPELTQLCTPSEIATLAGATAALPVDARDEMDVWRIVLDYWRERDVDLPQPVVIESAMTLLDEPTRTVKSTLAITALAIEQGLGWRLSSHACVVDRGGGRHKPGSPGTLPLLIDQPLGLAITLGVAITLHEAYLETDEVSTIVRDWLRQHELLTFISEDQKVLERLAAAGQQGHRIEQVLTDEQIQALREALESADQETWDRLGAGIGKAILLQGYSFDERGRRQDHDVRPCDAYQPKAIDRESDSFAVAAATTPEIIWIAARYAPILKSTAGRAGLGAQRFLRCLGCATAPRFRPHPALERKYQGSSRRGLARDTQSSPQARQRALRDLEADYSLGDLQCLDLTRVLLNVAQENAPKRRRERAKAVLGLLSRNWRDLSDVAEVPAVYAHQTWNNRGSIPAWWAWQAASIDWLDDANGTPSRPHELKLRTAATIAVHGVEATGYMHPDFNSIKTPVLAALGVEGEPSTKALLTRLRELRDDPGDHDVLAESGVVYRALAERIGRGGNLQMTPSQLRQAFAAGPGLVHTARGWVPPAHVFAGQPVFGLRRASTPSIQGTGELWRSLQIKQPGVDDCLAVLAEIATDGDPTLDDQAILLDTFRLLTDLVARQRASSSWLAKSSLSAAASRRLAKLPLWTTKGWVKDRPVYIVEDAVLASGLSTTLPVWEPGGEVHQFDPLFGPMRLTHISLADTSVVDPDSAVLDHDATSQFSKIVDLLKEELTRNDPESARGLTIPWDRLRQVEVAIQPDLMVAVAIEGVSIMIGIAATVDPATGVFYLRDPNTLTRVDGGGRAVAALFQTNHRALAHAWLAAAEQARLGREAIDLQLADERAQHEESQTETLIQRLKDFQATVVGRKGTRGSVSTTGRAARTKGASKGSEPVSTAAAPTPTTRKLVNLEDLVVVNPGGDIVGGKPGSWPPRAKSGVAARRGGLPPPKPGGASPIQRTSLRGYTELDKETLGLDVARLVLNSNDKDMVDLRAQHGFGADAMDYLGRFFELKVSARDEPSQVRLEPDQIERALNNPEFFLVVVSELEGVNATPQVRVITDPVNQLRMSQTSQITYSGIQDAVSLIFHLKPDTAQLEPGEET